NQLVSGSPTGSYTFAVTSGALPPGLALLSNGALTGTPGTLGSFSFTITATDLAGCTGSHAYSMDVCPAITVSPSTLPDGSINVAYSQNMGATGGTAPYTFSVTSGTLPTGLTLTSAGLLSGTPTVGGVYNFTITAADSGGCSGSANYDVVICQP